MSQIVSDPVKWTLITAEMQPLRSVVPRDLQRLFGKFIQRLGMKGHSLSVISVAWSADGRRVVSGSDDNTIRIWDVETGVEEKRLKGHSDDVLSVA